MGINVRGELTISIDPKKRLKCERPDKSLLVCTRTNSNLYAGEY